MDFPSILLLFFFCITTLVDFNALKCEARDIIDVRTRLRGISGDTLVSSGKKFELGFLTLDDNEGSERRSQRVYLGIWYHRLNPRTIVWVATRDTPLLDSSGEFGIGDGNLKIWCTNGTVVPITTLNNSEASHRTLQLLDSGNLILFDGRTGSWLWESFKNPTDTFLPGMKMDDENMELASWISPDDPRKGNYTFRREQGVYIVRNRSRTYWRSGGKLGTFPIDDELPYAVAQLLSDFDTGLPRRDYPQRKAAAPSSISFHNSTGDSALDNSTRLVMTSSGEIQLYNHSFGDGGERYLLWSAPQPQDQCSLYNYCGKFGICNVMDKPVCHCLSGFKPTSPGDWGKEVYTEGCNRESTKCSSKDEFLNLSLMRVGDQTNPFDGARNETECKAECLNNINCKAYTYASSNGGNKEKGNSAAKCWIWESDLLNLCPANDRGLPVSLRICSSGIKNSESTTRVCQPCGPNLIPYPLSTGPNCGDPSYNSFYCNDTSREINFRSLSGEYQVTGIYKEKRRFIILVDSPSAALTCDPRNWASRILKLNESLPFTVTNWCYISSTNSTPNHQTRVGNEVEIAWNPPSEPTCDGLSECADWPNSDCHEKGNGGRRCYCSQSYHWDATNANCTEDSEGLITKRPRTRDVIIFTFLAVGVILVSCSSYILCRRRNTAAKRTENRGIIDTITRLSSNETERQVNDFMHENENDIDIPFYNLDIILSATDNFSDVNKLGQGGFGPVYKGKFPEGREIAVKRLSTRSGQGIEEFRNEVILIAKLQHRNLVRLLGYCIKGNEKILLYEYMSNRSLDAFIFDQTNCLLLDWNKRFDIILGIARGLLYLHQDSRLRIIHRDLKTSNILLDEEMNPKISDFGLARIIEGKGTESSTNRVVGTYGYMSPEYALDGKFSIKSDVFSFGVVMLEIISGRKNTGFYNPKEVLNLLGYAWRLWSDDKALDLVDPTLVESCEKPQVVKCINIGLLCVQEDPDSRPTMSNVVLMLGSETSPLPAPTQPAFVLRKRLLSTSSSSSTKQDSASTRNEITISMAEGR